MPASNEDIAPSATDAPAWPSKVAAGGGVGDSPTPVAAALTEAAAGDAGERSAGEGDPANAPVGEANDGVSEAAGDPPEKSEKSAKATAP
jgi:hypothetical protein